MTTLELTNAAITEPISVPVGSGYHALVDAADYDLVARYLWRPLFGHNGKVYAYANVTAGVIYMHRLIDATPKGFETDHVNGDGLDNRRINLRAATNSQNQANQWKPRRPDGGQHASRFKGVTWDKSRRKWQSKIQVNGVHRNLGRYASEEEAAAAYDSAALAAWGAFARLNFGNEVQV